MSNFTDFGGGGIKSVQRGVHTPAGPAESLVTVSAVDMSKTVVVLATVGGANGFKNQVRLVSATQIGITSFLNGTTAQECVWQLVEYT